MHVSNSALLIVEPLHQPVAKYVLAVTSPRLWLIEHPTLYSVRTVVKRNGIMLDAVYDTVRISYNPFRSQHGVLPE